MDDFNRAMWTAVTTVFLAIVGVASLAVFFSKNANTANVITSAFNGLSGGLAAAEAPITGATVPTAVYQAVGTNTGALSDSYAA